MMRLARIVRHPIKSVGYEEVPETALATGAALPGDRRWAVAHAAAAFGARPEGWASKMNFVRGWASPALMAVTAESRDGSAIRLAHPARPRLETDLASAEGRAALIGWLRPLWPENRPAPAHVVEVRGQAMTDQPEPLVSILNLASLAELGSHIGRDLSIHRFRGNLWLEGCAPWAEWGWIGRDIRMGHARLRVEARIPRCRATHANPETGQADADILGLLEGHYGHRDFGVFARVVEGGAVSAGDPVEIMP